MQDKFFCHPYLKIPIAARHTPTDDELSLAAELMRSEIADFLQTQDTIVDQTWLMTSPDKRRPVAVYQAQTGSRTPNTKRIEASATTRVKI